MQTLQIFLFTLLLTLSFAHSPKEITSTQNNSTVPSTCSKKMAILAGTTVTSTGASTIGGNIGIYPGSALVGFPPGIVNGEKFAGVVESQIAQGELLSLYNYLNGVPCGTVMTGVDLGGKTLVPGVYCFATGAQITGNLYLDSANSSNPIWIFQMGTTLVTAGNSQVLFTKVSKPCGVFWKVGSSATIGATSSFAGNIVAYTSIEVGTSATTVGKLLAQNGAVTMISNTIVDCPFSCTNVCNGRLSNDTAVCSSRGSCTVLGTCHCQSGRNGTDCEASYSVNSSSSVGFSIFAFMISFIFLF
jgi:hypothetical protein